MKRFLPSSKSLAPSCRLLALAFLASGPLRAQEEDPPLPDAAAGVPAPPPATVPGTASDPDASIQLQFPNNGVGDILGLYELLTGKTVVRDSGIYEGKPLSLMTAKPVTKAEAVELIESTLQLNGYVLADSPDGRSVKAVLATATQADLTRGLTVHEQPDTLPTGHVMASYFLKLEHLDPSEAATTLWSHVGLNTFGRLTPVSSPPGILITENADNIRQILRVVKVLDAPEGGARLRTEFYTLKYADAVIIGQMLSTTFTTRQIIPPVTTDTVGDRETRVPVRAMTNIPARVVADDRLNRIMLVAMEADHLYAKKLIREFDQPIPSPTPLERRMKYVFVDQILPVLVDVLQDTGTGSSTMAGGEVVRTRRPPQASGDPATLAGRPRRAQSTRDTAGTAPVGYEDQLATPEDNSAPLSVLVGKSRLVADVQSNKLIAYGPAEDIAKITSLLDSLDHKPPQVYLSTIIGQLSLGDGREVGVDYLRQFNAGGEGNYAAGLITSNSVLKSVTDVRNSLPASAVGPLAGLNVYGQIADGVDAYIHALETSQRFKVLSRPAIYAANNKKAVITSGSRIPVPTSSITSLTNTDSVRTNIAFQDVVLKLEVIPLINSNKEVSLTIAQVNDTVIGQQQVAENTVPIIGTERLVTNVTVANRSTIVLGGLITENEEKSTTGIPVLSRIPVLGHAFKSTKTTKARKELVIFIQPVVVEDTAEVDIASRNEDLRTQVGADAAASFPEVPLPSYERSLPSASREAQPRNSGK
ncbi:MAG: Type secretion system protein [Verrucomicrobiales bacterium]|nr:Type secretion system protein [Verrucomicrobiales bacterium]